MTRLLRCCFGLLFCCILSVPLPVSADTFRGGLTSGFRSDALDWNIAGNLAGTSPNILSELSWNDLRSFQIATQAEFARSFRTRAEQALFGRAAYGWILSGDNRDSDYAGDNRTLEWSRSNNDAGDGHLFDLEGGYGVRFRLQDEQWSIMPNLGYAYYEQKLSMRDGVQTVSVDLSPTFPTPPPLGPFPGLDSSYRGWWFGPWLGVEGQYQPSETNSFSFLIRWHKVDYEAEANWNLRSDLQHPVSFEHQADGDGFSVKIDGRHRLEKRWEIGGEFRYIDFRAGDGLDIVYLAPSGVAATRLNEVNWRSWALSVSADYLF